MAAEHKIPMPPAVDDQPNDPNPVAPENHWSMDVKGDKPVEILFSKFAILEKYMDEAERRSLKEPKFREWLEKFMSISDKAHKWWDEYRINSHKAKVVDLGDQVEHLWDGDDDDDEEAEQNVMKRLTTQVKLSSKKVRSFVPSFCSRLSSNICKKTKELNKELDEILDDGHNSKNFIMSCSGVGSSDVVQSLPTTLFPEMIVGFHDDYIGILKHVMARDKIHKIKVICLIGEAGLGKTTLSEMIYNYDKVEQYFQLRRWVSVGNMKENMENIAKDITGEELELSGLSLKFLFKMIKDSVSRKKFFIVMDDVQAVDVHLWGQLKESLNHGAPGSKILLIARDSRIAEPDTIGEFVTFYPILSPRENWYIFSDIVKSRRPELHEWMRDIGMRIIDKCGGSPFCARIIASHLQFKDTEKEWDEVLKSEIWVDNNNDPLRSVLMIVYKDLSLPLQRCFLHMVVSFSNDFVINVEQLTRMWMAEGYLGPPSKNDKWKRRKGLEYFTKLVNYFNPLIKRPFFHNFVKGSIHKDKVTSFQMDARIYGFLKQNVQSEASVSSYLIGLHPNGPGNMFEPQCKNIKVLDLSYCQLRQLPKEVGSLVLLQHLNLSNNPLRQLPEALCDLQYLQFLDVHLCYVLLYLPQRIGDLRQLKHLRIDHTADMLQLLPHGFRKLTSIQTLDVFRAGGKYNDIAVLKNFNDLEELCIVIHGKVNMEDAELEKKTWMHSLQLCFVGDGCDTGVATFDPPPKLKMLKFEGYQGLELPNWIQAPALLNQLTRLTLRSLVNLVSLPELSKMQSLVFLWLYDIPKLKRLDREFFGLPKARMENGKSVQIEYVEEVKAFPSLRTLRIEYLENLATWEYLNEVERKNILRFSIMPHLETLVINGCKKLAPLPHRFHMLKVES